MNKNMTMNLKLSTTEPKNKSKLSKQLEEEQNHIMEITWRVICGERKGENGGKGTGN